MKSLFTLLSVASVSALKKTVLVTPDAPGAIGPYSQGIMVTNAIGEGTIYPAGQIGINPKTGELVDGGIEAQTKQLMENIKAILAAAQAEMSDIVECNCLLADLDEYDAFNKVYGSYFDEAEAPARAAF